MSWNVSVSATSREEVSAKINEALAAQLAAQPFDSWDDDVGAQQEAAVNYAEALVKAQQIRGEKVNVSCSGHRVAAGQQGTDTLSVSVSSAGYVSAADLEPRGRD